MDWRWWLQGWFGRKCIVCSKKKPFGTHYCDDCWKAEGSRIYGFEE